MRPAHLTLFLLLLSASTVVAQDKNKETEKEKPKEETGNDNPVVTTHKATIGGRTINYQVKTGTFHLRNKDKKNIASVFHIAYTIPDGERDDPKRPIVFSFNGGPGSSSVWLHLGAFGPRRTTFTEEGTDGGSPPYHLADNPYSLLDVADLVFIDPVSTGYSRPEKGENAGQFHGLDEDIRSVGEFIHLYTTRNHRWASPKFLAGESYGAVRASGLVDHLQTRYGMYLNGIMLISGLLDFSTLWTSGDNDLPHILFLPTMAATAHHHGQLDSDLQSRPLTEVIREVNDFAKTDYALALLQGHTLDNAQRLDISGRLARYTGLPVRIITESKLRISPSVFRKELLREEGLTLGRFDSRIVGRDNRTLSRSPEYDPSYAAVLGPFSGTINHYLREELEYEEDSPYEILKGLSWKYPRQNSYATVSHRLETAFQSNQHLQVFIGCGHFDLATPPHAILHSLSHLDIPEKLRENITVRYYDGGHMMYTNEAALKSLKSDLSAFVESSTQDD
ncbi:MAG: peptidase S10 [Verrucomicrobiota bacterium]